MSDSSITFYYQPNKRRKSELTFFNRLKDKYPNSKVLNQHFLVDEHYLNQFVDFRKLASWLMRDALLPNKKRLACLDLLKQYSFTLCRIALQAQNVSFDVVAQVGKEIFYWEFDEKQHQRLSLSRPGNIYTPAGEAIKVPRYFQRLMRDVWRSCFFDHYTVIWEDWLEQSDCVEDAFSLSKERREFSLDGKFSFRQLVQE